MKGSSRDSHAIRSSSSHPFDLARGGKLSPAPPRLERTFSLFLLMLLAILSPDHTTFLLIPLCSTTLCGVSFLITSTNHGADCAPHKSPTSSLSLRFQIPWSRSHSDSILPDLNSISALLPFLGELWNVLSGIYRFVTSFSLLVIYPDVSYQKVSMNVNLSAGTVSSVVVVRV